MSLDYSTAKPSLCIEEQVPNFVIRDGQKYIEFIKTYYDWLERKFVIVTLSADSVLSGEDFMNSTLSPIETNFILETEEHANNILVTEINTYISGNTNIGSCYILTENQTLPPLVLNVISYLPYNDVVEGIYAPRLMVFCEYVSGIIQKNTLIYTSNTGTNVFISDYIDVKSPLNIINNLESSQEVDFIMNYNNYIYNSFYINGWKELMFGFPFSLHPTFDQTIKDIIVKNVKDLYKTKGTFLSFKYMFNILYNESLTINSTANSSIYSDGVHSYVITSKYGSAQVALLNDIKRMVHPVGFKVTIKENS